MWSPLLMLCVAYQSYDGSTCLWDVRTGVCEMKFTHQETGVTAVKFQPGGEAIASAGNDGAVSSHVHVHGMCMRLTSHRFFSMT